MWNAESLPLACWALHGYKSDCRQKAIFPRRRENSPFRKWKNCWISWFCYSSQVCLSQQAEVWVHCVKIETESILWTAWWGYVSPYSWRGLTISAGSSAFAYLFFIPKPPVVVFILQQEVSFLTYGKLRKITRVSKTLMRGGLRRRWRWAQPAFLLSVIQKTAPKSFLKRLILPIPV